MPFYIIQDSITLRSRDELIATHIYMQFKKHNITFSENDINVLVELHKMNGYRNKEEQDTFFKTCLDKNYKKVEQSVRNTLNKYTEAGFLVKPRNLQRFVNKDFIPSIQNDKIGAIYKLSYVNQ